MTTKTILSFFTLLPLYTANISVAGASIFDVTTPARVSVHDPSVVIGYSKDGTITGVKSEGATEVYYIFGTHRAFARSSDMQSWETFTNNISTDYKTIFSHEAGWASRGGTQNNTTYDVTGNMWAPDVVWNPSMQKWCMYMSINGDNYYSSIALLTAESLDGNWTRVGTVVYSGFVTKTEAQSTDFYTVHTGSDFPSRYTLSGIYTLNAIDPCAFFDQDGNMWLTYGSWFGGLYMLRLDKSTGLRDYTYTYPTTDGTAAGATSDEYLGHKIAGGNGVSGEASYIEYINDRYFLFVTYGGLTAAGGYNMRVFSSTDVLGPYTDLSGQSAIYSSSNTNVGNLKSSVGSQLMNYYQWNTLSYGYVAEGHCSAAVDDDGKAFLVYHTRFTNRDEDHEVRVHQLFSAENGGLVAAPFEYRGETLATTPYSMDEVVGTYNIIYHNYTDYADKVCNTELQITLNADSTVTGNYRGTWSISSDGPYITITFKRLGEMKGVLIKQKMEGLNYENLCFSVIGTGDIPMWGYKNVDDIISEAAEGSTGCPVTSVLGRYSTINAFNSSTPVSNITATTGLSLSFYVSGLTSDWNSIAQSTDSKYTLYLSVLHYNSADFYENKSTVSAEAAAAGYSAATVWQAFLNDSYYVTVSFNADGTIAYYRDSKLMLTYAADTSPSWYDSGVSGSSGVTPASIVQAVISYYLNSQLDFTQAVYAIVVGYSVPYDEQLAADCIRSAEYCQPATGCETPMYNLNGQRIERDYHGIVVQRGKVCLEMR